MNGLAISTSSPQPTTRNSRQLFKDGIGLIYSFLTFTELLTAVRIARPWYQVICDHTSTAVSGKRSPLVRYTYQADLSKVDRYQQFLAMLQSPARALITTIPPTTFGARIVDLEQITNGLPQLTECAFELGIAKSGLPLESMELSDRSFLTFPTHLISLTIDLSFSTDQRVDVVYPQPSFFQHLFSAICNQVTGLQKLAWGLRYNSGSLDVSGLLKLTDLTELEGWFSDFQHPEHGYDIVVQCPLKRWKSNARLWGGTKIDWSLFHADTALMKNLESWTITEAAFTLDDYRSLASNASVLTCLDFQPRLKDDVEGLRYSAAPKLRNLKLRNVADPCRELMHLTKLQSLTLEERVNIEVDSWLNLFARLTCLEEIDFSWSVIPAKLVSALPKKTTIRRTIIPSFWVDELFKCARLQELYLIDCTGEGSCTQLKEDLREICNSSGSSLRWVEVRNVKTTLPGTVDPIKSTFLLDSSPSIPQASDKSSRRRREKNLDEADPPFRMAVDLVEDVPPLHDLTRFGVEPNPGPFDSNFTLNDDVEEEGPKPITVTTVASPSHLFKDGLFIIYSFLTLREFIQTSCVCHHWYQPILDHLTTPSAKCPPALSYTYEVVVSSKSEGFKEMYAMLQSPFRHFVTSLRPHPLKGLTPGIVDLPPLVSKLPQLIDLALDTCILPGESRLLIESMKDAVRFNFPTRLLSLTIRTSNRNSSLCPPTTDFPSAKFHQQLFDAVCNQALNLERLVWVVENHQTFSLFDDITEPELDISGLLKLVHLTDYEAPFNEDDSHTLVQIPLKRWKALRSTTAWSDDVKIDWNIFHGATILLMNLDDWSLDASALSNDDYRLLVSTASRLKRLTLHMRSFRPCSFEPLALAGQLHHLHVEGHHTGTHRIDDLKMDSLTHLRSLAVHTFAFMDATSWSTLLKSLVQLEQLDIGDCGPFPDQAIIDCPKYTTIRNSHLSGHYLLVFLTLCQRLQELSLIDVTIDGKFVREECRTLCLSTSNTVRRIEAIRVQAKALCDSIPQTFIFDSPHPPITRLVNTASTPNAVEPIKDLTRYGIELHHGPTSTINTQTNPALRDVNESPSEPEVTAREEMTENMRPSPHVVSTSPSHLFKDGLLIIYSFLSLKEFIQASGVCHHWYQPILNQLTIPAPNAVPPLRYRYYNDLADSVCFDAFLSMLQSPARRFVTLIEPSSRSDGPGKFAPSSVDFYDITDRLPNLTHLSLDLSQLRPKMDDGTTIIPFSNNLISLRIELGYIPQQRLSRPTLAFLQQLLNGVCQYACQLERLVWLAYPPYWDTIQLDVSGLLKLKNLTDLTHRFCFSGDTGIDILVQCPLKRWHSHHVPTPLNWTIFHPHTPLMTHLEDWTLHSGHLTNRDDFMNIAQHAHNLISFKLILNNSKSVIVETFKDGLRHLSQAKNLRHFHLEQCQEQIKGVFTEISHLTQLESLTFKTIVNLNYDSWRELFLALTCLERLELDDCEFPVEIISHLPTCALLRGACIPLGLTHPLSTCSRLHNLSLIDFHIDSPPLDMFKNELNQICLSNENSLIRIECVDLRGHLNRRFICQSFIFDSPGKGRRIKREKDQQFQDSSTPIIVNTSDDSSMMITEFVGNAAPFETDLTRYGIESNPGPFGSVTSNSLSAQTLFLDGLLSIFGFLSFYDLLPALHSCHYWYSCGLREKCREMEFDLFTEVDLNRIRIRLPHLNRLFESPFKFHVTSLMGLSVHEILVYHTFEMVHIRKLEWVFRDQSNTSSTPAGALPPSSIKSLTLPTSLTTLQVSIRKFHDHDLYQSFLKRLTQTSTPPHLQRLVLESLADQYFDFSSLITITTLRHLTLVVTSLPKRYGPIYQQLCANLPLQSFSCHGIGQPDWTIFHPKSTFMLHIEDFAWRNWYESKSDWVYLTTYPPPRLRTLTLELEEDSYHNLSPLNLTSLHLKTSMHWECNCGDGECFLPVVQQCRQSLTQLRMSTEYLKDQQLSDILLSLPLLNQLELEGESIGQAWRYLPPNTIIHNLTLIQLGGLIQYLSQAKRVELITIVQLTSMDRGLNNEIIREWILTLCQKYGPSISQIFHLKVKELNRDPFNFSYHHRPISVEPSATPSGHVESNPKVGPSIDSHHST